jgi:DNA (cytosine-5)-methyltransferase 1
MKPLRVLDLFSGIGGFSLGLHRTGGFETVGFCELDAWRRQILSQHFPGVWIHDDARTLTGDLVRNNCGTVDLICGGDPCQDNSNACQAAGALEESLGGEFIRLVSELLSRFVWRENSGVVRGGAPWPWQRFCLSLERLGYYTLPIEAHACCFGADHRRARLFVLAALQDADKARLQRYERSIMAQSNGRQRPGANIAGPNRRHASPRISRATDGIPRRVDRIKALGDTVYVPAIEAIAQAILTPSGRSVSGERTETCQ